MANHKLKKTCDLSLAHNFFLVGIVLLFLVVGSINLWSVPPFEGPDEAQHYAYIKWLITEGSLPPQGDTAWQNGIEQESGQPPFYYFIASLPVRLVDIDNPPAVYRPNPHFVGPLPRASFDNDNRAIYYDEDTHPLRGGWLALFLARGVSLSFGVLLIVAIYGLVRQVWPESSVLALGSALLVAMTPQVLYISSMASNDIPAAALSTLALWLFATYLRQYETRSPIWGVYIGIVLGLAGLTKVSGFTLSLCVGTGLVWLWLSRRRSLSQVIQFGLAFSLGLLLVSGWWLGRNWISYGALFGLNPHDQTPWAIRDNEQIVPMLSRWMEVWRSYWLAIGWGTIRLGKWPGGWSYHIFFGLLFLAFAGWLRLFWQWWHQPEKRPTATTIALLSLLLVAFIVTALSLEIWMHRVVAPYGRLLFPAIGAITIFLLLGWHVLHPRLSWLALGYVTTMGILTPFILIAPAYTHKNLSATEIATLPPSIGWRFGETSESPFAELISFTPQRTTIYADEILPIDICWRALSTVERDYSVMVQALGLDNHLVVSQRSYPDSGRYPTSQWEPGQVWCETMHVQVYLDLEKTMIYRLEVSLMDTVTNERLPATNQAGEPLTHTFIAAVRLVQPATQQFATNLPPSSNIHLTDSEFIPVWQVGTTVPLTLTWAATEPLEQDYQVFIHLRDTQTGENVVQADGPPVDGLYPSTWWSVNELIPDVHLINLPSDLPPGSYRLVVGLYDLVTNTRPIPEIDLGLVQVE